MKQVFGHCINVKLSLNVMAEANLCRLCAAQKDSFVGIYEEEGHKLSLESKITKCLQIELYPKDPLPKAVCLDCCAKLNQCSDFFEASAQAQVALHMILLQPKKEELVVLNVNKQSSDPEQSAFLQPQQDSNSCEDDPTFESDSPEYVENVAVNSVPEGPNEDSDSLPSSKRKRKTPIRWTLQTEGVPQTNTTELPETRGNHQIQTTTNIMKETESVSHMCAVSGALPELEQTVGGNEEASPRKRRDGWDKYPWMCTDCAQELPSMQALRNHHQTVHNQAPRFMCAQCSKVYTKYYGFVSHVRRHRNHMKFCCEQCGKCFSNKKVLESHRATHSDARPYVCSECGKTFRQQSALYVHSRSHQPENIKNRFPCDQCDKRFSTKPNLVTHKRIHSGVRNFTCDQCGKSFIQKGNLDAHLLTHSSDKPHLCPVCNKGFKTPLQLRKHQSVHTGAKPHQCDVCGRQFRERGTLREHHRIHTGAMPFTCEFCGKCFRFKGILTTHRRQHTGERPYSCLECQHHFTNWPNYNKHMKRRHGINTSHQPDPNKIALANLAASSGAQPANILVMQHPINQQPVVTSEQQRQHQPAPHQPLPPPPPSLTQQQQPSAILVLGPAVQMDHSSAVSAVQYSHHTGVPVSSQHLQVHSVDRSPVGGTHFYSPAQTAPYNTAPPSVLGFYNLQPTVPGLENTSGPMDMLPPVQQR